MSIRKIIGGRSSLVSLLLNISGMAMAFAAMYIIVVQVSFDLGFNRKIKDSERIYSVTVPDWYNKGKWMPWLSRVIGETVIDSPLVECGGTASFESSYTDFSLDKNGAGKFRLCAGSFSKGAMEVFSIEAVEGSLDALTTERAIAVSETKAAEFGISPGDILYMQPDGTESCTVVAVFRRYARNTDLYPVDYIYNTGDYCIGNSNEWSFPYFVKLRSEDDRKAFEEQAFEAIVSKLLNNGENLTEEEYEDVKSRLAVKLFSIEEMYYDTSVHSAGLSGSRTTAYTLLAIAILVIVIAFINFVNFFFALVPVRLRSVNTRKILGASRLRLVSGMMAESVAMIAAALLLAGGVVKLFGGSGLASLIVCDTSIPENITVALCTAFGAVLLAIVATLYPAFYITSFSPAFALKGSLGSANKGKVFRYGLIGFQFVVSISLIVCACFVSMQRNYMMNYDMGFDRGGLLEVTTSRKIADMRQTVTSRLKSVPAITDVTWTNGTIVAPGRMGWGREFKGETISFQCYPVSWNFLRFMGIDIVEGRDFTESDEECESGVFIFNEAARDKFGITLEDRIPGHMGDTEVAGFCKNFNYMPLSKNVEPFALYIFGKTTWKIMNTMYVRLAPDSDIASVIGDIKTVLNEMDPSIPEDEINVSLFDSALDSQYRTEKRMSRIVMLFTVLAIVISLMGVFGLVMFDAEYRRKEIGIRRVNGATVSDILLMFNTKFAKIVLVCFVIAVPLSWYIVDAYLKGFAYRMPVYWWIFALSLLAVLLVTLCVVTLRCLSAATADPVDSIKTE